MSTHKPGASHPWRRYRRLPVEIKTKKQVESRKRSAAYRKRNKK